jgi:hypothetical protein
VRILIVELRSGEYLLTGTFTSQGHGHLKEMPADKINLKNKYENIIEIKNLPLGTSRTIKNKTIGRPLFSHLIS